MDRAATRAVVIQEGARNRLREWALADKNAHLKFKAFGVPAHRLYDLIFKPIAPTLREALVIDCITEGSCSVYDWVDTEYIVTKSRDAVKYEVGKLDGSHFKDYAEWPRRYAARALEEARRKMVKRLSSPGLNAFSVVVKYGAPKLNAIKRNRITKNLLKIPVHVDESATDEQVKRAIEKRHRRQLRADAYERGTRASTSS